MHLRKPIRSSRRPPRGSGRRGCAYAQRYARERALLHDDRERAVSLAMWAPLSGVIQMPHRDSNAPS
eukprot:350093-Chlamydomonas_euryale.AAC.2